MRGLKLLIVAASAMAALVVGLGAQAHPLQDDLQALLALLSSSAF